MGAGWRCRRRDGSEAYSRRGDLRVDENGLLVTGNNLPVMGNGGPIAIPPFEKIDIGVDGTVSIRPLGAAAAEQMAVIDRIKMVAPQFDQMEKGEMACSPERAAARLRPILNALVPGAGDEQRQRGQRDGRHDRVVPPLRTAGQDDEDRRGKRQRRHPASCAPV